MFFYELGQNLQNIYFNEVFLIFLNYFKRTAILKENLLVDVP